ncbi:hypothetical protein SAMN05444487_102149 [Marininema mesophilum]|uniref:Uncharacterized protein n=1 Tax=Marininema mesophilum TaxID=1048340 RepID=A0A1H2SBR4_9BACL|nr:hypothetical protein [Marininema mesophilum]SDW28419.1 hypothetical protein SAMN05444487_102149 [Marininema mesophilum]
MASRSQIENQVFSNRVLRAEFNNKWVTRVTRNGFIRYKATAKNANLIVLLTNGQQKLIIFPKGGEVLVGGGGASFYSKPHIARNLP